jgi:hypothetical protein
MKYTFTCEDIYFGQWKNSSEFETDTIDEVVENFNMFLRGSGFNFQVEVLETNNDTYTSDSSNAVFSSMMNALNSWSEQSNKIHLETNTEICPSCKLSKSIMMNHCEDQNCPLEKQNAN